MVVTCNDHVNAFGLRDHAACLTFRVCAEDQIARGGAGAAVVSYHDKVTAGFLHFGNVVIDLPCDRAFGIIRMVEDDAGIVVGNVPARTVGRFQTQNADFQGLVAYSHISGDVGLKDRLSGGLIIEVAADCGNTVFQKIGTGIFHGFPSVVEFVVAEACSVVADICKAERHCQRIIGKTLCVLIELHGGYGRALIKVAVINKENIVFPQLSADLIDSGFDFQHIIGFCAVGQNICVPAFAMHIRGRENGKLSRIGLCGKAHRKSAEQQGQRAEQGERAFQKIGHKNLPPSHNCGKSVPLPFYLYLCFFASKRTYEFEN